MPTHGLSFGAMKVDLSLNKASLEAIFMKNHRKSLIQHCERSELHFHFECYCTNQQIFIIGKTNPCLNNFVSDHLLLT